MRLRFANDDLRRLHEDPDFHPPNLGPEVVKSYRKKVGYLESADTILAVRSMASLHLEKLRGKREGQHSIRLNRQWRLILRFEVDDDGTIVVIIEIVDYH